MKTCPKCGKKVNSEYLFCPICGENLKNCRYCGKELPDRANYCPYCGKAEISETAAVNDASVAKTACTHIPDMPQIEEPVPTSKSPRSGQAHNLLLTKEIHQDIIKRFKEMHGKVMGSNRGTKPMWEESTTKISLSDTWEHWVGHDDTLSESIGLSFSKVWVNVDNVPWTTESEWPCSGQALVFDKSRSSDSDDPWDSHYSYVTHKAWLLKEPYGLPGLWRFEYKSSKSRY